MEDSFQVGAMATETDIYFFMWGTFLSSPSGVIRVYHIVTGKSTLKNRCVTSTFYGLELLLSSPLLRQLLCSFLRLAPVSGYVTADALFYIIAIVQFNNADVLHVTPSFLVLGIFLSLLTLLV